MIVGKLISRLGSMINATFGPCCMVHLFLTGPVLGTSGYRLVTVSIEFGYGSYPKLFLGLFFL